MSTKPVKEKDDVQSNDKHIRQDFPGFPHEPSSEKQIKHQHSNEGKHQNISPEKSPERSTLKDKKEKIGNKNPQSEDVVANGSASAFDATEKVNDESKTDEDNNDLAFRNHK